jgi:acetyltransferase-like isoleucine patch superfamily enzyme
MAKKKDKLDGQNIIANKIEIGKNVSISPQTKIVCDVLRIGDGTVIVGNSSISCKECTIGKNNFISSVMIEGALNAGNTRIRIGDENLILQNTRLNCNEELTIGNDVNIGQYVSIWTHASSMNVLDGYPYTKKPVKIGSHVWITAGTTVLPGVEIGSHVIIGNMSLVNINIPSGCFAAGTPVKIIKEKIYPKQLSLDDKRKIISDCIQDYLEFCKLKGFEPSVALKDELKVEYRMGKDVTVFDLGSRTITGKVTDYSEDFRDFLRYHGIKIFTGVPFKSITPNWYTKLKKK